VAHVSPRIISPASAIVQEAGDDPREALLQRIAALGARVDAGQLNESSKLPALVRLLIAKGLISEAEMDAEMVRVQVEALQAALLEVHRPQLLIAQAAH
jgi:hypothetical protein